MPKLESGVLSITVEVEGRRLSFTFEEARTLKKILNDMFGGSPVKEYVPIYPSWPSCSDWPYPGPSSWEYHGDSGSVTFTVGLEDGDVTTY